MGAVTSTTFDAALKQYYSDEEVRDVTSDGNPLFGMISKAPDLTGKTFEQPIQWGRGQGRSASIQKAIARQGANKYDRFSCTTADDYGVISIERKVMKTSGNMRGAFFQAQTREIDSMLQELARSISWSMFRNSGGAIGRVSTATAPSTTTLTLNESEDMSIFEAEQVLVASDNDGSVSTDVLLAGSQEIASVNEDGPTLTGAGNWTAGIPSLGVGDFLFIDGDFQSKIQGFGGWMSIRNDAAATPGTTAFFGVDRSQHVTRLAGRRITAIGDPIHEAVPRAARQLGRNGHKVDCFFCSHQKYQDLQIELSNKVVFDRYNASESVGYESITIRGPHGPIKVYADRNCPDKFGFLIAKDDWTLRSIGPVPDLHDEDGVRMLRNTNDDSFQVRASYYAQMVTANTAAMAALTLE